MIIHQPEIINQNGHTIVFSRIELRQRTLGFPDTLWFRIPERYALHLSLQSDAFLIPGLITAMRMGEDLEVYGMVSPKLAYHLQEYQGLLHFRIPDVITPVEILYHNLAPLTAQPTAVGTSFSGGVDSFFTLWQHLPQNQPIPDYQVTHALFILGFDIRNPDKEKYQFLFNRYQEALRQVDVELLPLETNLLSLNKPRLRLIRQDGALMIGAAHVLGGLLGKFLVPSSFDYLMRVTWLSVHGVGEKGPITTFSDSLSDLFLSSDTLRILHHGATHTRSDKLKAISDWQIPQEHLRVCHAFHPPDESLNCGKCDKCIRTMIPLYAFGKSKEFTSFPRHLESNRDGLWWARKCNPTIYATHQTVALVRQIKPSLTPFIWLAVFMARLRRGLMRLIPGFIRRQLGRYGHFIDLLEQPGAFEDPEVQQFIQLTTNQHGT